MIELEFKLSICTHILKKKILLNRLLKTPAVDPDPATERATRSESNLRKKNSGKFWSKRSFDGARKRRSSRPTSSEKCLVCYCVSTTRSASWWGRPRTLTSSTPRPRTTQSKCGWRSAGSGPCCRFKCPKKKKNLCESCYGKEWFTYYVTSVSCEEIIETSFVLQAFSLV